MAVTHRVCYALCHLQLRGQCRAQQPGSEDAESHGAAAALTAYVALSSIAIGFFPITASDVTVTFHMLCHKADQVNNTHTVASLLETLQLFFCSTSATR